MPAPIQARDIPTIQQQYLEERHIQLYQPITTFSQPSVVTVLKNEPASFDLKNGFSHFQTQTTQHLQPQMDTTNGYGMNGDGNKLMPMKHIEQPSPAPRPQQRKKERRKIRASSMESSIDSESAMDTGADGTHQVAAVSSTANFKSPMHSMSMNDDGNDTGEKQVRKRVFIKICVGFA